MTVFINPYIDIYMKSGFNFYRIGYTYYCYLNHSFSAVYAMGNTSL